MAFKRNIVLDNTLPCHRYIAGLSFLLYAVFSTISQVQSETLTSHALSMYGDIKYGADFTHFEYVNPDAPKGGHVRLAAIGTYDSFNPFIIKGLPAAGLPMIYDGLLESSQDEPFTEYGRLAETIEMPDDRSWVTFTLRPEAQWHDGVPITADDVIYSFELLTTTGNPFYRSYYASVEIVEKLGDRTIKFTFNDGVNRELPLIMGQFTVLPKHYWETRDFSQTTLEPPLGSGPYRIETFDAGRSITYSRVREYWGKDLPVNRGRYNFNQIQFDYYRDATVAIEALKAHEYDFRAENISKEWATAYDIPSVKSGDLIKELIPHESPTGMQGFFFNSRRTKFSDPFVRRALAYAFDFEWTNTNLFYGQYTRTKSYFSNTELASQGLPEGQEKKILEGYRDRIPEEVFTAAYDPPSTDGSGEIRENLRTARALLETAGWTVIDGALVGPDGTKMTIEFLLVSPAFERIVAPMVQNLARLGINGKIRIVDTAQYQNRLDEFDFDVIVVARGQSLSPGNEQRGYWTSEFADLHGSQNFAGVKNSVVDELVEALISAPDRESLVAHTRALDRVLLWSHYVVPHWHIQSFRFVYWNMFGKPEMPPKYGISFPNTWWYDKPKHQLLLANNHTTTDAPDPAQNESGDSNTDDGAPNSASPDEFAQAERDTMIYLAFLGIMIVVVMLYLRRRTKRPT